MPTYSYACTVCDNKFDIQQAFSDDSLTVCPECGGRLRKLFNSVGIVFKGSGFYRTDSRAKAKAKAGSTGSGAVTEKKADGPADGKASPAAKTPEKSPSSSGAGGNATSTSSSTPAKSA